MGGVSSPAAKPGPVFRPVPWSRVARASQRDGSLEGHLGRPVGGDRAFWRRKDRAVSGGLLRLAPALDRGLSLDCVDAARASGADPAPVEDDGDDDGAGEREQRIAAGEVDE
jgi:hypothetical protein